VAEPFVGQEPVAYGKHAAGASLGAGVQFQEIQVGVLVFLQLFQEVDDVVHFIHRHGAR
jgi:hypothetical protein